MALTQQQLEAVHHLERQGRNAKALHLFGQEMNLNTWAICRMHLFLHDIDDADIKRGDTLRDPKHLTPSKCSASCSHTASSFAAARRAASVRRCSGRT